MTVGECAQVSFVYREHSDTLSGSFSIQIAHLVLNKELGVFRAYSEFIMLIFSTNLKRTIDAKWLTVLVAVKKLTNLQGN